jgi:hypothetical protein
MSRRSERLDRIERAVERIDRTLTGIEDSLSGHADDAAAARMSADAAHAGVQALADMLATAPAGTAPAVPAPKPPQARRRTAAGTFAPESTEAAERLHKPDAAGGTS